MSDDDEPVGYGKPPKDRQWPQGTSGNPSGRKKGSKDFGVAFRKIAYKKTQLIESGKPRLVSMIDAVMRAPVINGLNKNKKNLQYALELMEEFGLETFKPTHKVDEIYRDYEGKLAVTERLVPRNFERLIAEFESKNPDATKAWLKEFARVAAKLGAENG
jgi:hypothetical protein